MDMLNANFQSCSIKCYPLMKSWLSHHYSRQFIKGKPCRFGFRNCSSTWYCYVLDTYCKKSINPEDVIQHPLGSKVVPSLIKRVSDPNDHIIFFDNYLGLSLLSNARPQSFRATGKLRQIREMLFIISKKNGKKERRTFGSLFVAKKINYSYTLDW